MKSLKHFLLGLLALILCPVWLPLGILYGIFMVLVSLGEDVASLWAPRIMFDDPADDILYV